MTHFLRQQGLAPRKTTVFRLTNRLAVIAFLSADGMTNRVLFLTSRLSHLAREMTGMPRFRGPAPLSQTQRHQ